MAFVYTVDLIVTLVVNVITLLSQIYHLFLFLCDRRKIHENIDKTKNDSATLRDIHTKLYSN